MSQIAILLVVLGLLNIWTLLVFGFDKLAALLGWRRISERTLLTLICLGGSVGGLLGMWLFHHKVSKESFQLPLILILLAQIIVIGWFLYGY